MAFDRDTRNRLAHCVGQARELLKKEFADQLQSLYGISPSGSADPLDSLTALNEPELDLAELLRERIAYLATTHSTEKTAQAANKWAVDQLEREQAFTILNRMAAVRMAEKRGIVQESVAKAYQSRGFKVFDSLTAGSLGEIFHRYRHYLECLFDELAVDLGALFDRRSPQGLLFPRETALLSLLELFNAPELDMLWAEDETIGWIYQYYNDPAERKEMREKSSAPRNSRELAVRNQFFTPRYVVEFLTDNTLGRIWYEMTHGETALKEQCRYLVCRPTEIFLAPDQVAPAQVENADLSQEELLKQPVYIPHRPRKDPRTILMLDPACGSMHFGLYAFDLLETIYREAWELETAQGPSALVRPAGMKPLLKTFADQAEFLAQIPRLIIENNIHGVDIDPRATQIAALSLWLRAHRAWSDQNITLANRPRVARSNIVCAEPMPGDAAMLGEFVKNSFPPAEQPLFQNLLEQITEKMQLAGEAGSLLKIEEEIRSAVEAAQSAWKTAQIRPKGLFGADELRGTLRPGSQQEIPDIELAVADLNVEADFWETAEERIYQALADYAEGAEEHGIQRRLFAEDAARGFAFIDVCRKRYDVVLMNPPFGEITPGFKHYASKRFRQSKADILCMFVERMAQILAPSCFCAAITNRTPFFTDGTQAWREAFCLGGESTSINLFADLGHKVLDSALVETAAYCLKRTASQQEMLWFNLTQVTDKQALLMQQIRCGVSIARLKDIAAIPGKRLSYWLPTSVVRCYSDLPSLAGSVESVDKGMSTTDDFRFIRAFWEVPNAPSTTAWMYYSKGGEYSPFASDVHLAVNWRHEGREIDEVIIGKYPYLKGDAGWVLHPETHHGFTGLTYTKRTTSSFSARLLPAGARVSDLANLVYDSTVEKLLGALVCLSTSPFHYLLDAAVPSIDSSAGGTAARHYEVGTLREVPVPSANFKEHADTGTKLFRFAQERYVPDEATNYFNGLPFLRHAGSLVEACSEEERKQLKVQIDAIDLHAKAERSFIKNYDLDEAALEAVYDYMGPHPSSLPCVKLSQLVLPTSVWKQSDEQLTQLLIQMYGGKRRFSKQTWVGGREIELWAYVTNLAPAVLAQLLQENNLFLQRNSAGFISRFISFIFGVVLGRWDIRYATGDQAAPELPDPFAALPVCPPGQLQNAHGLPAGPEDVPADYPVQIPWNGILVDDANHPCDIVDLVRKVIEIIWKDRAEAIEQEACEILGVKSLRDYFRKPTGFFADHLKRYSKSRRQAPIYWPLSTASGSYTLWIYYHRLTDQTLHSAIIDFVAPKLAELTTEISNVRQANNNSDRLEELLALQQELLDFQAELNRLIKLPWKPNLNDGVLITASPLWKLFRLPKWQKDLKATWTELEQGDYDWAHLAYSIWPTRVEEVCKTDRSIAIAHGLEHLCAVEAPKPKRGRKAAADADTSGDLFPNTDGDDLPPAKAEPKKRGRPAQAKDPSEAAAAPKRRGRPPKNPPAGA